MCTLVHFLTRYMRPEQRPAAALADSSEFSSPSLHGQVLSPTTVGHSGATLSPTTLTPPNKGKLKVRQKKRTKESKQRKIQPRAGPARPLKPGPPPRPCPRPPGPPRCPGSDTLQPTHPRVSQKTASVWPGKVCCGNAGLGRDKVMYESLPLL